MKVAKILIVEDDADWLAVFRENLEIVPANDIFGSGYGRFEIEWAANQQDAETLLAGVPPRQYDLVLLDLRYPLVSGGNVDEEPGAEYPGMKWLPELRRLQSDAAIVILTSWAYENELRNAVSAIRDYAANDFVPKTAPFGDILGRIYMAVENVRRISRLARLQKEYRSLLRSLAARTYAEDAGSLLDQAWASFSVLAKRLESGDTAAIREAPERIRAEFRSLVGQFRRSMAFMLEGKSGTDKIDVAQLTRDVLDLHEDLAIRAKAEVLGPDGPPAVITTFTADLKIALHEVLVNAMEALEVARGSEGSRRLEVKVEPFGDEVLIRVTDNGDGFSDDAMQNMFQLGYSARSGTNGPRGIGLYIARRMMLSIGGGIRAGNRPEGGAEVVLTVKNLPNYEDSNCD